MLNILFFELLQVAIGSRDSLSRVPSADEWMSLYKMAQKQALVGVCFYGVQRLPKEMLPPKGLLLQWFAIADVIRQRNLIANERAKELTERFEEGGFRSCVLKGQGIARFYSESDSLSYGDGKGNDFGLYRQSGDIDLWVDGRRKEVLDYSRTFGTVGLVDVKQADFKCFEDIEVEIHSIPAIFYSPLSFRNFCSWLKRIKEEQFSIGEMGFACPTIEFNVVYVLIHIYRHMFDEGVGLRQLMDYYFVLLSFHGTHASAKTIERIPTEHSEEHGDANAKANATLRSLGMERFVSAVMWLLQEVFGLERELMLCEPSEKYGRRLLDIVMEGGNFGQYDKRNFHGKENALQRGFRNLRRNMLLVKDYPSEVLWAPFWKVWHFVWRMVNFGRVD